ncbi:hypothetical protein FW754_15425 [Acinetobacter sp. 1207_04]
MQFVMKNSSCLFLLQFKKKIMNTGDIYLSVFLFGIGFTIYLAKSIATSDQDSWKVIGAKAVLNGFTSLMAGSILIWASVPTIAVVGAAAMLGTLGSELVIKYLKRKLNKNIKNIKLNKE